MFDGLDINVSDDPACTECGSTDLELIVMEVQRGVEQTRYICNDCGSDFWLPEEDNG